MINIEEKKILNLIRFGAVVVIILISIFVTTTFIDEKNKYLEIELNKTKELFISNHKEVSKTLVTQIHKIFEVNKNIEEELLKSKIKTEVRQAHSIIKSIYDENIKTKGYSEEKTLKLIIETLRNMRFDGDLGYIFIFTLDGNMILNSQFPQLENKNHINFKNVKGSFVLKEMIQALEYKDETYFNWYYRKPNEPFEEQYEKLGYLKKFKPYNIFVGSGVYMGEFEKEVQKRVLTRLNSMDQDKNTQIFVYNQNGLCLSCPNQDLIKEDNYAAKNKNDNHITKELLDFTFKNKEGFIEHKNPVMHNSKKITNEKISYLKLYNHWNWIIGSGFYLNDMEKIIEDRITTIERSNQNAINKIFLFSIAITIITIAISLFLSHILKSLFIQYQQRIIKTNLMLKKGQQQSHLGSWEQSSDDNSLEWSDEVYRICEIDMNKKMLFDDFINRVHPEDRDKVTSTFQQSIIEQSKYYLEHRLLFPDGRIKYVKEHAEHYYDEDGKHIRTAGTVQDVTIEELSKKELAISNDKFEKAFNTTPNIIVITNLKTGKIYEVNQTFEDIMGYKREDVVGKTTLDINLWSNSDEREAYIKIFREKRIVENSVYSFKKKNGDLIIAKIYANVVTIDNEAYILAVVEDITKRLEAEGQLENFFAMSNIGLAITSLEKGWIRVNKKILDTLGYTEDELKQTRWSDITHPDDIEKDTKLFNEVVEGKRDSYKIEKRFLKKDGTYIYAILTLSIYRYDDKIEYFLASILDISELKKAQEEFKIIIEEAPNPIMVHNEDGKVILVNKVWQKLTGYKYDEIDTIEKWTKKAYGEEMPTVKKYIDGLYELKHAVNEGEYQIIRNDGEVVTWQFSSAPLGFISGKRTIISSAMDITELKKKDEMLIKQSRQAAMGDMIAMIAHQWRQPITVIGMEANNINMNILLEEEITTEELKKMADSITEQTQQLSQTIDDFRNFFKPNQEKVQTTVESVFKSTFKIVGKSLENNNIALVIENRSETKILTYPNQLLQVFLNLLGNAKDVLLDKEVSDARIIITIDETKDSIVTKICDNGGGIPKDAIKRLGEPYFTTKETSGTGLGLYMSITIVKKHLNGTLTWENRDKGACFIVTLPKE